MSARLMVALGSIAAGVIASELYFTALSLLYGGSLSDVPVRAAAMLGAFYSVLAFFPWWANSVDTRSTVFTVSMIMAAGWGLTTGFITAFMFHLPSDSLATVCLLFLGFGMASGIGTNLVAIRYPAAVEKDKA
jgi:hypothetical protein